MERKARILIVDDEDIIRNILKKLLLALGHEAITASGSKEAIAIVQQQHPDIVLLDIVLPGDNSMDIVKSIRQGDHSRQTTIVMISAHDNLETMATYIQAGADDFLLKPFNATLFKARMNRALADIQTRRTIQQLESRVSEAELKLHKAEQEREKLCSDLSHDLNNALTGIMMTAEMILLTDPPADTIESVNEIIQSSDEINGIIKTHRAALRDPKPASVDASGI